MRWLFLFVLAVNIIFVGWEMSQSEEASVAPEASTENPTIELLSESGRATKVSTKVPAKTVAKAIKSTQVAKSTRRSSAAVEQPIFVDRCFTLGPFRELDNLRTFTRSIRDYVIAASFRSREEQEQSMFLVYLEPEATLKKARILGRSLKRKKIKDFYVISSGEKENGISLGHFKEKDRARSHATSIKKLGFKPMVEPVFKSYTLYWLDYHVPAGKVIPQKTFSKQLSQKINRLERTCS